ncbi:ATP-binding cassette domain-containing protein [Sinorhizobium medicae]|nr:ATP-binding cassette domain-containing protein [Sinorhizobium medicae]
MTEAAFENLEGAVRGGPLHPLIPTSLGNEYPAGGRSVDTGFQEDGTPVRRGAVLAVRDLSILVQGADGGWLSAVQNLSFDVRPGEVLGLVGESGSGKSLTCLALMDLLPPALRRTGEVFVDPFGGTSARKSRRHMAMIFQDPVGTLNPVKTIGAHLRECLFIHQRLKGKAATAAAEELLERVRISDARAVLDRYCHQLSGGMNQRVGIALALATEPRILVADEPTTALDVRTQEDILEIIDSLRRKDGLAVVIVTHDLSIVAAHADRVLVLYGGSAVEYATRASAFSHPRHPYLTALLDAIPRFNDPRATLPAIEGTVPAPGEALQGCNFYPRCGRASPICRSQRPRLTQCTQDHSVACHYPNDRGREDGA